MTEHVATTVVVPCFNEADRIDPAAFLSMTASPGVSVLFVDDGSADRTGVMLLEATQGNDSAGVLALERNRGKAEAVRAGMSHAIENGAEIVGYLDADQATQPAEWLRLADVLTRQGVGGVFGSRVAMLGYDIQRRWFRHYTGRIFATLAAVAVGRPVYDTQCGAKVFAVTPRLVSSLAQPFHTRWVFDVELLQRLLAPSTSTDPTPPVVVIEEPLQAWVDRPGSSLSPSGILRSVLDVLGLIRQRRRVSRNRTGSAQG